MWQPLPSRDTQTEKWFHQPPFKCKLKIIFQKYWKNSKVEFKALYLFHVLWNCDLWIPWQQNDGYVYHSTLLKLLSLISVHCMHVMSHGQWVSMVSAGKFKGPFTYSQDTARKHSPSAFMSFMSRQFMFLLALLQWSEAERRVRRCQRVARSWETNRIIESNSTDVIPFICIQLSPPQLPIRSFKASIKKQKYTN